LQLPCNLRAACCFQHRWQYGQKFVAARDGGADDRRPAHVAVQPLSAEHVRLAEVARAAAGLVDVAGEAGAAAVGRCAEDALDRGVQAAGLGLAEAARRAGGADAGAVQDLVGVDVADARDGGLIEQHSLDRGAGMPGERLLQRSGRETVAQRLGSLPAEERIGPARVGACQSDPAEPSCVVVVQAVCGAEPEDGPGGRVWHLSQHARGGMAAGEHGGAAGRQDELAGHLGVDEQAAGLRGPAAGFAQEQDQDLAPACYAADLVAVDVQLDRVVGSVEDLAVQDADSGDRHAGDARG
jgi:hypothetical protein